MIRELRSDDLIFIQRHWGTTLMFYYLQHERYRLVGEDFDRALREQASSRVWVIKCKSLDLPSDLSGALEGREPVEKLEARYISAELYTLQ